MIDFNFPELLTKAYKSDQYQGYPDMLGEITSTIQLLNAKTAENNEEHKTAHEEHKPSEDNQQHIVVEEKNLFLVAGSIVNMWRKDGSSKEMHFFLTKEGDEVMGKKPFTKEPEKEFRLKVSDFVKVMKGYDNDTPFNKPKGWFTKSILISYIYL
jgi:hypothetical protein